MYSRDEILKNVDSLYNMWKKGSLGGEIMPEDVNPHLDKTSKENYLYFTLPMALNYQRTHKLGLITDEELNKNDVQSIVVDKWNELFKGTKYKLIDIHTPLWLWSRNDFREIK